MWNGKYCIVIIEKFFIAPLFSDQYTFQKCVLYVFVYKEIVI